MDIFRLFRAILFEPLTAGDVVEERENSVRYDGCISSLMGSVMTISIVFVIICVAVTKGYHFFDRFANCIVYSLRFCGAVAIIAFCIYLFKTRHRNYHQSISTSTKIKVKFLWFFGFLFSTYVVSKIIEEVLCLLEGSPSKIWGIQLFYHLTELFWILFLTGFMSHFVRRKHRHTLWFNWGISILTLAVTASWSYPFIDKSFMKMKNTTDWKQNMTSESLYEFSEKFEGFYPEKYNILFQDHYHHINQTCNSSTYFRAVFQIIEAPISYSVVEFYLMVVILLLEVLSSTCVANENIIEEIVNVQDDQVTEEVTDRSSLVFSEEIQEQSIELSETVDASAAFVSSNHGNKRGKHISMTMTLTLMYLCIIFIPQVLGTLLPYFVESDNIMYIIWYGYLLLISTLFFISYLFAFYKLQKSCECKSQHDPIRSKGFVFILCSSVDAAFSAFSLIPSLIYISHVHSKLGILACARLIIDIITNLLQTIFILHARKFKKKNSSCVLPIENVCLILAVMNLGWWFQDNFGKYRVDFYNISGYYIAKKFYGLQYWHYFAFLALPVSIFYRLHSFIDLYAFYLMF